MMAKLPSCRRKNYADCLVATAMCFFAFSASAEKKKDAPRVSPDIRPALVDKTDVQESGVVQELNIPSAIQKLETSFTLLTETDSNARRRVEGITSANRYADVDADLRLELEGSGSAHLGKTFLWARATVGGKLFLQFPGENMSVARVDTATLTPLLFGFQLGWRSTLKGRIQLTRGNASAGFSAAAMNHQRTYGWVQNEFSLKSPVFNLPFVDVVFDSIFGDNGKNNEGKPAQNRNVFGKSLFEIGQSSSGFASKYLDSVGSFVGSGLFAQLSFWATKKEFFSVRMGAFFKTFPYSVPERLVEIEPDALPFSCKGGQAADYEMRSDLPVNGVFSFTSSRKIFFSTRYSLSRNASNSCGNAFTRHRLSLLLGVALPASLTLSFDAALQFAAYDDGVGIGQQVILQRDDESQNRVVVRLKRPLFELLGERLGTRFYLEGRVAYFSNEFSSESANKGPNFSRIVFSVGLNGGFSLVE